MSLIFWLSAQPRLDFLASRPDHLLHGGAYFVLAILAAGAFAGGLMERAVTKAWLAGLALAVVYGASDEWHQSFVPGRVASLADWIADVAGALAAVALLHGIWFIKETMT